MISFQNFTPQENLNGDVQNLFADDSMAADFDNFLNLFIVVPEANTVFPGAEIPQELNENPIGIVASEISEPDTQAFNDILSQPFVPSLENKQLAPEQIPNVVAPVNPAQLTQQDTADIDLPPTPTVEAAIQTQARPRKPDAVPILEPSDPTKATVPEGAPESVSEYASLPVSDEIETLPFSNLRTAVSPAKLTVNHFDKLPAPPTEKSTPVTEAAIPVNAKPIADASQPFNESHVSIPENFTQTEKQRLSVTDPIRTVPTDNPVDPVSIDSKPQNPQPTQTSNTLNQIKTNPTQTENAVNQAAAKPSIPAAAQDQNTAQELGFRVLPAEEKPRGLGRTLSDFQNYPELTRENPSPEKPKAVLTKVSEIIHAAKAGPRKNVRDPQEFQVPAEGERKTAGAKTGLVSEDAAKTPLNPLTEIKDTETPKKQPAAIKPTLDPGPVGKEFSPPKLEPVLTTKTFADVKPEVVIEQIKTPLLDLASMETESKDPRLLKFRLKPAELGSVEIRLEKNLAGKLEVHFQIDNDAAKQILAESFEQLRNSLQNAGWQVERMEISNGSLSPNGFDSREDQSRKNESVSPDKTATTDETPDSEDDLPPEDPNRLVNLRA
ncbi:MAG: hypothetical protein HKN25_16960 [Pyrinomonadaceae bacterium]|nr:hypothetical protein [Pyrinomonadaceae bacterium]